MATIKTPAPMIAFARHGAAELPGVVVDDYNAEIKDGDGFIGDRASNRAFREILEEWREKLRKVSDDPLGETSSDEISKKKLDKILTEGDPEAAGVVHGAIEDFAKELATVTARFLKVKAWKDAQRIVVGGGLRASRVGELAIGRAGVMLKAEGHAIELLPIRHHPDHAGLVGTIHLAPSWIFGGYDAVLAVDIGGSNIRVGIVTVGGKAKDTKEAKDGKVSRDSKPDKGAKEIKDAKDAKEPKKKKTDLAAAEIHATELWRHREEKPKRDEAVEKLVDMLKGLVKQAEKDGLSLAPFVGIGCPGVIEEDGSIARGGQNLPGNWESSRFNLPEAVTAALPKISGHETHVLMHNDAVVQGLSQFPFMSDVERWGVLTIGTGLGNAVFTNRAAPSEE